MQSSQAQKAFLQKQKILKKYLSQKKINKQRQYTSSNFFILDQEDRQQSSISVDQSSQEEQLQKKRVRIQSQSDQNNQQNQRQKLRQQVKSVRRKQLDQTGDVMKSRKLKKKLKKALGVQNDEQIDQFMKQIKIEGMELSDLKKMLKNNNIQLNLQSQHKQKKEKRKKDKKSKKDKKIKKQQKQFKRQQKLKFQAYRKSSSSDIQIPVQARTIYRNKDGTIKINTDNDLKKKKEQQTINRLAQWEKGMRKQDSDQGDHQDLQFAKNDIWDDPLKVWNQQTLVKPLTCRYMGPSNRFNIKPGYRWDGVIRGNGFQTKYIQDQSLKKARSAQQHKEYLKNL